jgi:hypothetical protein
MLAPQLHRRQPLPRRLLLPVRPGVGTDDAATGADHAGPERRYRDVIRPAIGAQHSLVVAEAAGHIERADAQLAHVAERHRFDRAGRSGGIRLVLIRRTRARGPCRNGFCFVGLQPANMVDDHLVVRFAWFDVEDSLGKRPVTLDGTQPYRERQVGSHQHGPDYVSRSCRRLLREGTGKGKRRNNETTAHLIISRPLLRERLASRHARLIGGSIVRVANAPTTEAGHRGRAVLIAAEIARRATSGALHAPGKACG